MPDLDECVRRAIASPVAEPPELAQLARRAKGRRRRRVTFRSLAVLAVAGVVAFGTVAALTHHPGSPQVVGTPGGPRVPRGWRTVRDPAHGLSISYPSAWRPAASTLTPVLVDPTVPLALGTYALQPQRLGECDIVPQRALEALGPRDAFIAIYVYGGEATGNFTGGRPAHFTPQLPWFQSRLQCTQNVRGRVGSLAFSDEGRRLQILIAIGPRATPQRQRELYRILDTLTVTP